MGSKKGKPPGEDRRRMIDPERAIEGLMLRIQGKPIPQPLRQDLAEEAAGLERALDDDDSGKDGGGWSHGPAGTKNTPVITAGALGLYLLLARLCRHFKRVGGQGGLEYGSPGFYHAGPFGTFMVALRDARAAGDEAAAAAIAEYLRAVLTLDALSSLPVARLRDRVVGGRPEVSTTAATCNLSTAVAGNRWTPEERGDYTSENAHAELLARALNWPNRGGFAKGTAKGAITALLGKPYGADTGAHHWGLDEHERTLLRQVVSGNVISAGVASKWLYGLRTARGHAEAWRAQIVRTEEGVQSVFFGPNPNPNKPARAATLQYFAGDHVGLQPSSHKKGCAGGYRVWLDGDLIYAYTDQGGEHSIFKLGGRVIWRVEMVGTDVELFIN